MKRVLAGVMVGGVVAAAVMTFAQGIPPGSPVPRVVTYEGRMENTNGTPVADGPQTMLFQLVKLSSPSTVHWTSNNQTVTVSNGRFVVQLGGSGMPAIADPVFNEPDLGLRISVGGTALTPIQPVNSVLKAVRAETAQQTLAIVNKTLNEPTTWRGDAGVGVTIDPSGNMLGGILSDGVAVNCGFNVNTGTNTLTIQSASNTALSDSNPCFIGTRRANNGGSSVVSLSRFKSNVVIPFPSTMGTNSLGITGVISPPGWNAPIPMFLGVVQDQMSGEPFFTLSRLPVASLPQGTAGAFCLMGDNTCTTQQSVIVLAPNNTDLAGGGSVTQVGWFRIIPGSGTLQWTLAGNFGRQGFNHVYETESFTFPTGVMGAASGLYFGTNGPQLAGNTIANYTIGRNGWVHGYLHSTSVAVVGTGGALLMALPFSLVDGPSAGGATLDGVLVGMGRTTVTNFSIIYVRARAPTVGANLLSTTGTLVQHTTLTVADALQVGYDFSGTN